jgi:hypothetical protein
MSDGNAVSEPAPVREGGCVCGTVRFTLSRPLLGAIYCHCTRCQRRTGSAFSATALAEPGSFEVTTGADSVRSWDPGDGGWIKAFCGACGGHLYTVNPANADLVAVRLGAIDGDPGVRPAAHQFTDYAAVWEPLPDDGLPRFPERLPASEVPTGERS